MREEEESDIDVDEMKLGSPIQARNDGVRDGDGDVSMEDVGGGEEEDGDDEFEAEFMRVLDEEEEGGPTVESSSESEEE